MKRGKKYRASSETVKVETVYELSEGIKVLKGFKKAKFDETVEVHVRLATSAKKIPQNITGKVLLPSGTGKEVRVAVIAKGDKVKEATAAGADRVGFEDIIEEIKKGKIDFDFLITTPDCMKDVSRVARIIGPKGLMPTPKAGSVTFDVGKAVESFKSGLIRWKVDSSGNIHAGSGKLSFPDENLVLNIKALIDSIRNRLLPLGDDVTFIPGHGPLSTLGDERRSNPYVGDGQQFTKE